MGWGKIQEGLYFWATLPKNLNVSFRLNKGILCNANSNKNILFHQHLGHSASFHHSKCHIFPIAKQSRLPFSQSTSHSKITFSLLHMNIWGPYHTPHRDGSCFFLTIVDDYTRTTWLFLMQSKARVFSHVRNFLALIKNQFHKSVQRIRTNNAREFFNHECSSLFTSNGILHESSCIYTP